MKTPEEIKRGLVCCGVSTAREMPCRACPYDELCREQPHECHLIPDALAYIVLLEGRIAKRDALLAVLGVKVPEGNDHEKPV